MKTEKYNAPASARTLRILEYLADCSKSVTINNIADTLGISLNSTYRIVSELDRAGYIQKADDKSISLTPRLYYLGLRAKHRNDLNEYIHPIMKRLSDDTGETVLLCSLTSDMELFINDQVESPLPLKFTSEIGRVYSSYNSAMGKVLLAFDEEAKVSKYLKQGARKKITKNTITDETKLCSEFAKIRSLGVGFDNEESMSGLFCIGAPVYKYSGKVEFSIGISGPKNRVIGKLSAYEDLVKEAGEKVSVVLGYSINGGKV